jgi:Mg2+-importing ATPase
MTIARDSVDNELVQFPQRWDIGFIRKFMFVFGTLSSVFDFLTFAVLWLLNADVVHFRTGWFLESVVSATLVVLVVRTRRSVLRSQPSRLLTLATLLVIAATVSLPWTPLAGVLGFAPPPARLLVAIALIVAGYVVSAEIVKAIFYARFRRVGTQVP